MITMTDDQQAARKTTSPAPSRHPLPQTAQARIVSMTENEVSKWIATLANNDNPLSGMAVPTWNNHAVVLKSV